MTIVCAVVALLVAPVVPPLNAQLQPIRGVVSGHVQTVSNGVLTLVTDSPAYNLPEGTKVNFALTTETMIFDGTHGRRAAVSDIHNYLRATVQYDRKGDSKVAVHIRLFQPIQPDTRQPQILIHMPEAQGHIRRGDALYNRHDLDGAIAEYRKAIGLDPNYVNAHINLGNALDDAGRTGEAIQEYLAALRISPLYALAHYNLALALEGKGDAVGAKEHYMAACSSYANKYCPAADEHAGRWNPGAGHYTAERAYYEQKYYECVRAGGTFCHAPR